MGEGGGAKEGTVNFVARAGWGMERWESGIELMEMAFCLARGGSWQSKES